MFCNPVATRALLITGVLLALPAPSGAQGQDTPTTPIPEIMPPNGGLGRVDPAADPCVPGADDAVGDDQTLTEQLDACGSILQPPEGVDPSIQAPAPDPTPNTTPVIPPGALPPSDGEAD